MNYRLYVARFLAIWSTLLLLSGANAATVWNETVDGDLSGDYLNPTSVVLASGANSVFNTFSIVQDNEGDWDIIHVQVPAGRKLTSVLLQSYISFDGTAFIAMSQGPQLAFAPELVSDAHFSDTEFGTTLLYGWSHFGPFAGHNPPNADLLPSMSANTAYPDPSSTEDPPPILPPHFTPPLPAGDYTFWMQQLSGETTVQLDFVVSNPVLGDFNLDGARTKADLLPMLQALANLDQFQADNNLTPNDLLALGDFNDSSSVTHADIQPMLDLVGAGSLAPVPEPSAIVLALCAFALVGRKYRRVRK